MISDRNLADAILARKPDGARRIEIDHDTANGILFGRPWSVSLFFDDDCIVEVGETLAIALNKAEVSMRRKRAEATRQKGLALVFTPDAVVCEREGRN